MLCSDLGLKIKKQKKLCSNVCANNFLPHKFVLDDCLVASLHIRWSSTNSKFKTLCSFSLFIGIVFHRKYSYTLQIAWF